MGKKSKDRTERLHTPLQPAVAVGVALAHDEADANEEHVDVKAAKRRAKAAEGSAFGQEAARLRRDLFGAG